VVLAAADHSSRAGHGTCRTAPRFAFWNAVI
jgi:hypothetical protein